VSPTRNPQLEHYRRKRDPQRTPEPFGEPSASGTGAPPRFVVQKHWARNMHYDLRLELDGTLKSWAVPKGIPIGTLVTVVSRVQAFTGLATSDTVHLAIQDTI